MEAAEQEGMTKYLEALKAQMQGQGQQGSQGRNFQTSDPSGSGKVRQMMDEAQIQRGQPDMEGLG